MAKPLPPGEDGVPRVHAADRAQWRAWLAASAASSTGVWLVYDKGPGRSLRYDEVVEEALAFGRVVGLMTPAGTRPDDLRAALDAVPAARHRVERLPRSARRALLEWSVPRSARPPEPGGSR